jgi:HD-like signal output (HDOD) protein
MTTARNPSENIMSLSLLFEQARALPVVPRVLQALLTSFDNPALPVNTLAQLITSDPVICARLLRQANSARYHRPQTISTANEAVQLLGFMNARSLVISLGLMSCFEKFPADLHKTFWQHSLRTAALARRWSVHAGVDGELAYTLGLLHCLGQLVMRQGAATQTLALDAQVGPFAPTRISVERAAMGYSYAEVGAELVQRWQFPVLFSEVIGGLDTQPVSPHVATLIALIQLAAWQSWVSEQQLDSGQVDALWPEALAQRISLPAQQGGSHFGDWTELSEGLQDLLGQP